jgi:hypothetical protein
MNEILIGAFIAIGSSIITVAIAEYVKYYLSSKKDELRLTIDSLIKMKKILLKIKFDLLMLNVSSKKIIGKSILKFSPSECFKLWDNIIELNGVAFELSTYPKTKNLSKSVKIAYEDAHNFINMVAEKTNSFETQISEVEDKEIFEEIQSEYDNLKNEIERLMETEISIKFLKTSISKPK